MRRETGTKKELVIGAIYSAGVGPVTFACEMTKLGMARFTGNQWNESWEWNRDALEKLDLGSLNELYLKVKR